MVAKGTVKYGNEQAVDGYQQNESKNGGIII